MRSPRKIFKISVVVFALLMLGAGAWLAQQPRSVIEVASIPSRYYAKETCTCRFVLELPEEFCTKEVKEFIPSGKIEVDTDQRVVTSSKFFRKSIARWISKIEGCRVISTRFGW